MEKLSLVDSYQAKQFKTSTARILRLMASAVFVASLYAGINVAKSESSPSTSTSSPTHLSSCQEITQGGVYLVDTDITTTSGSCLRIHNLTDLRLDCQGHSITNTDVRNPILAINSVGNFSVTNCKIDRSLDTNYPAPSWIIRDSRNGEFSYNILGGYGTVQNSQDINIDRNSFSGFYQQFYSTRIIIQNNVFNIQNTGRRMIPGVINLNDGTDNTISNNTINGGWDGKDISLSEQIGADDGIIITNEKRDTISGNQIFDTWDVGIETVETISDTKISNNQISRTGYAGIGAWIRSSWDTNSITNNYVSQSPKFFLFYQKTGLLQPQDEIHFSNIRFIGNTLTYQIGNGPSALINMQDFDQPIPPDQISIGNVYFEDNNFGTSSAPPILLPATMIIDGGNNICSHSDQDKSALNCHS